MAKFARDTAAIFQYVVQRNSFDQEPSLRNIATGVLAEETVNVCDVKKVGESILLSMNDQNVTSHSFKKKNQAVIMDVKSSVKV